jgi:hypothetical protein
MKPINSHGFSRRWLGVGMALMAALAAQAQTAVTFQIDMSSVSPTPTAVYISGSFNGWPAPGATVNGGFPVTNNILVNVSGTIWSNTFSITDAPGVVESCKFQYEPGDNWEGDPNRQFVLGTGTQVLPLTSWNVKNWPAPTNEVTFQLNLNAQILTGAFVPGGAGQTITVSGDFENYGDGQPLTNNPTLPGALSNIYTGTFPVTGFPGGTSISYKFRENGGWENPTSTGGGNRSAAITNSTQVLPLVFYNDASTSDLVLTPTVVTFTLNLPNGALDNGGVPFVKGTDTVYINGDFLGWYGWNTGFGGSETAADQMTNNPLGSDTYQQSFTIPAGTSLNLTYKYSVDAFDDENGFATNHIRYIRSYGPSYTMPLDQWSWTVCPPGTAYPNPGISSTNITEPSFGYLAIQPGIGSTLPITWLGRPAVVLQSKSSLSGVWVDNPGTDATQATNWPNGGGNQFFRLKKNP